MKRENLDGNGLCLFRRLLARYTKRSHTGKHPETDGKPFGVVGQRTQMRTHTYTHARAMDGNACRRTTSVGSWFRTNDVTGLIINLAHRPFRLNGTNLECIFDNLQTSYFATGCECKPMYWNAMRNGEPQNGVLLPLCLHKKYHRSQ